MNTSLKYCRLFAVLLCALLLASPVLNAEAKSKGPAPESNEALVKGLEDFGRAVVDSFNRCVMPNKKNKHVVKNSDGTYTAEYMEADPKTVSGNVKPAVNPGPVKYIGYLRYTEIRQVCTANTKEEALKGPFKPMPKTTTELIKYMNGKWTY